MAGRKDELFTRGVCLSKTLLLGVVLLLAVPMETIANCSECLCFRILQENVRESWSK